MKTVWRLKEECTELCPDHFGQDFQSHAAKKLQTNSSTRATRAKRTVRFRNRNWVAPSRRTSGNTSKIRETSGTWDLRCKLSDEQSDRFYLDSVFLVPHRNHIPSLRITFVPLQGTCLSRKTTTILAEIVGEHASPEHLRSSRENEGMGADARERDQ